MKKFSHTQNPSPGWRQGSNLGLQRRAQKQVCGKQSKKNSAQGLELTTAPQPKTLIFIPAGRGYLLRPRLQKSELREDCG